MFSKIDYLVPDASETEDLSGIFPDTPEKAAQAAQSLVQKGIRVALVKMKDGGCVLANKKKTIHIPPVQVEVKDTTGAGDAFAGALAVAVLEGQALIDAACFATAASLATVRGYGSQPAYPKREDILKLYNQVKENLTKLNEQK